VLRGVYRFKCRFETDAVLPAFKGSVLRGAFGRALRQTVCTVPRTPCSRCRTNPRCLYPTVFDRSAAPTSSTDRRTPAAPYVIEPPETQERRFAAGAPFAFGLLLFGDANHSLPYIIYSFERAGMTGVGAETDGARGRFRIEAVESSGNEVFCGGSKQFSPPVLQAPPDLAPPSESMGCTSVQVTLQTPLRLKASNHLNDTLPFHVLVAAALRRIADLHNQFGGGEPALDYSGLVNQARAVTTAGAWLRWSERRRYSAYQQQEMLFGGLVGEVHYTGEIGPFIALLAYGAELHLGKQTTFGLGKLSVGPTD